MSLRRWSLTRSYGSPCVATIYVVFPTCSGCRVDFRGGTRPCRTATVSTRLLECFRSWWRHWRRALLHSNGLGSVPNCLLIPLRFLTAFYTISSLLLHSFDNWMCYHVTLALYTLLRPTLLFQLTAVFILFIVYNLALGLLIFNLHSQSYVCSDCCNALPVRFV